jgi:hypothetical protein
LELRKNKIERASLMRKIKESEGTQKKLKEQIEMLESKILPADWHYSPANHNAVYMCLDSLGVLKEEHND